MPAWTISPATRANAADTVHFIDTARRQLFPLLADSPLPRDLAQFSDTYLDGPGHFLVAHADGQLIAGIGYLSYDHRFPQLDYRARKTVEIVRLFVTPDYRRFGLAAALFDALREHAAGMGVECLYLHTHPFLPGAIRFWERQGFRIRDIEADPQWQTTHMERALTPC
jgi:GNAT superfamily N-acetyltransferase